MNKLYHLSTCSTCARIVKELNLSPDFPQQDIKTEAISEAQLDKMAALSGSYESLFSRRAMKYKELGLKNQNLSEEDYKNYILKEYTFLKRPVLILGKKIFVGNSKKVVASAILELQAK
ncbi:arsenate reductase family protein [Labilibaculum sp.]|uniref:arsenate reductase family protein n=1 Tax=Labilibaculum sp. TaxID=2060723 RepID=UPI003564345B